MASVEQTQKMIPFVTCEISFGQHICELVFWCRCIWFGSWGPNWFYQTTNQEQLFGFWKHVIVGLLPFMIILITAAFFFFFFSNTYNQASWREAPIDLKHERRFPKTATFRSHSSRASKPSNLSPMSKDMISNSVPNFGNKSMTSKNAQCSSRSGLWIFKISREVRVLKQSQSALLGSVPT